MATAHDLLHTLHGACACGRNRYVVEIPSEQTRRVELRYDNTSATRSLAANPSTFWLRVPLGWYTSATFAQFPDETRTSIQRTFTSPFSTSNRRQFCGYCGTQLTSWHEQTRDDADHISLTVGSLLNEDQARLADLGFLPDGDNGDEGTASLHGTSQLPSAVRPDPMSRGAPWFEEMIESTRLGRIKQQWGGHASPDGRVQVEWEVLEYMEGDDTAGIEGASPSKRKLGDVDDTNDDTEMRNV